MTDIKPPHPHGRDGHNRGCGKHSLHSFRLRRQRTKKFFVTCRMHPCRVVLVDFPMRHVDFGIG